MEGSVYRNPRDGKSWRLQWDEPGVGKRRRRTKVFRGTKRDAEKLLRDILSSIDKEQYVEKDKQALGVYLRSWLADVVKISQKPNTYDGYWYKCKHIWDRDISALPIQQVTTAHLQAVVAELVSQGLAHRSVSHFIAVMRNALNVAVENNILVNNPATKVKKPAIDDEEDAVPLAEKVWQEDTVKKFLEVGVGAPYFDAYCLIMHTGLRRGELCGLRWSSVDLDNRMLRVSRTRYSKHGGGFYVSIPKSKTSRRYLEITEKCVQILRRIRETQQLYRMENPGTWPEDAYVICRPTGQPMRPDNLDEQFLKLIRKHGLPHTTLHRLRHLHGTMLNEQGFGLKDLSQRMGHSSVSFTHDRYIHVRPGANSEKLKGLDDLL